VGFIIDHKAAFAGLFNLVESAGNYIFVRRGSQLLITGLQSLYPLAFQDLTLNNEILWYGSMSRFGPWVPLFFNYKDFSFSQSRKRLYGKFMAGLEKGKLGPKSYVNKMRIRVPHF